MVNCIRLTLVGGYTHQIAGTAAFGEDNYVWGINVGVAATAYLRELLQERETARDSLNLFVKAIAFPRINEP